MPKFRQERSSEHKLELTDFTTYDQIRSALGVSAKELKDDTLQQEVYMTGLLEDMWEVSPNLLDAYSEIPEEDGEQTAEQKRVKRLMTTFATFSVAKQLVHTLPMFAPRTISDGRATMTRFLDPYKETIQGIEERFNVARDRLGGAVADLLAQTRQTPARQMFVGVGLAYDPVTGE